MSAVSLANAARAACNSLTSDFRRAELAADVSIFDVSFAISSSSSPFFSSVLEVWSSQYAFSVAAAEPSFSSFAIRSLMRLLTFAKTSSWPDAP